MHHRDHPTSLRERAVQAGLWSMAGLGLSVIIRFGSNLLMTRLLAPEMFGVMAIASTVLVGLAMFSDLGLKQNVVQSARGHEMIYLNTAWTIQIIRGLILFLVGITASLIIFALNSFGKLPVHSVYATPVLPYVIAFLSCTAIVQGLESTKLHEASRKLLFGRVTCVDLLAQMTGLIGMVSWASVDRSIWALVAGSFLSSMARAILSHACLSGTPNRLHWDSAIFWEIIGFGKWIFLSSVIGFLVLNGDRLILGGLVDSATLGVYVVAYLLASTADLVVSKAVFDVSLPVFSEIVRLRPTQLRASYYKLHAIAAFPSYFCSGFLLIAGQAVVSLLYDSRYAQAGWMLEILSLGLLAIPFRVATECFIALGMPQIPSLVSMVRLITLFVATPASFVLFGLTGALWGIVLSALSWLPIQIFFKRKFDLFELKNELFPISFLIIGLLAGCVFNFTIKSFNE
jgi:O-antigen/teichoic acid export membrane protein